MMRAISDQDLIDESNRSYDLGHKHGKEEQLDELEALRAEVTRLTTDRDEISEEIERCHVLLDKWEGSYDPEMTSADPLDVRLEAIIEAETPVITDDDVNGDD